MKKKIGIVGGLGPMATVTLMRQLGDKYDQVVINDPTTPDRTNFILNKSTEDPTENILNMIEKLELYNVDLITMPCNTASYFYNKIKDKINCPFLNIVEETAKFVNSLSIKKVGLLATNGTIESNIYKNELKKYGIEVVIPDDKNQNNVMDIIYKEVKANKKVSINKLYDAIDNLKEKGAERVIFGCTELSVIYSDEKIEDPFIIDSIKVLSDIIKTKI